MIVGRWYVQLAAIWHWYLPLCVYTMFKKKKMYCLCLFLLLFIFSSVYIVRESDIDKPDRMVGNTTLLTLGKYV